MMARLFDFTIYDVRYLLQQCPWPNELALLAFS